jgi:hypothetical protein
LVGGANQATNLCFTFAAMEISYQLLIQTVRLKNVWTNASAQSTQMGMPAQA